MKQHNSTKEKIIEATIDSIYKFGYSDTTIISISKLAEISQGSINHHFDSKENLLEQTMRHLLVIMHKRVLTGTNDPAASPRSKLWSVIESVLADDQADDKTSSVWLSFWVQAEHDDSLRRLRDIYNQRLNSNVSSYLRQILQEVGAQNIEERTLSGTFMIISAMHGAWISHVIKQDDASDLSKGRLLVWECLEMLLLRSRENLPTQEPAPSVVTNTTNLIDGYSIEIIAADMKNFDKWRKLIPEETRVYIPHFRGVMDLHEKISISSKLIEANLKPIPHIAARNVNDPIELERIVAAFSAIGVTEFLLLAGGESSPVGDFTDSMQLLQTGLFQKHDIRRVGFAGHPEEHPDQSRELMRRSLIEKIAVAKASNLDCYIVTQFCFTARPFLDFLNWAKEQDFGVPIRVGLAGRVNAAKLLRFSAICGIGRSMTFIKRQFGKSLKLMNYSPEGLTSELSARLSVRDYGFPIYLHFYLFGSTVETISLLSAKTMNVTTEKSS